MTQEKQMERVLVTGGGGFLGKAIVRKLRARGDEVRSFSRGDYPELRELGVEVHRGDIRDKAAVEAACEGCDVVIHVAARVGVWGKYEEFYESNVVGTQNVLSGCTKAGVGRLVYTSSPSVVFDGGNQEGIDESVPYPEDYEAFYPQTKAEAERCVKAASSDELLTAILRPHLIWGPEDNHLVPRIIARARSLRIIGDGTNMIDTVYIDNAADAHIQAVDALKENPSISGRAYFISQGEPVRLWDMVNWILKAGGKPPVTKSISYKAARFLGGLIEDTYRLLNIKKEPRLTRFVVGELAKHHWFDISAAKRDLHYNPSVSTQEGLQRLEQWLKPS